MGGGYYNPYGAVNRALAETGRNIRWMGDDISRNKRSQAQLGLKGAELGYKKAAVESDIEIGNKKMQFLVQENKPTKARDLINLYYASDPDVLAKVIGGFESADEGKTFLDSMISPRDAKVALQGMIAVSKSKETFNTLTPEAIKGLGLPPGSYQKSSTGKILPIGKGDKGPSAAKLKYRDARNIQHFMGKYGLSENNGFISSPSFTAEEAEKVKADAESRGLTVYFDKKTIEDDGGWLGRSRTYEDITISAIIPSRGGQATRGLGTGKGTKQPAAPLAVTQPVPGGPPLRTDLGDQTASPEKEPTSQPPRKDLGMGFWTDPKDGKQYPVGASAVVDGAPIVITANGPKPGNRVVAGADQSVMDIKAPPGAEGLGRPYVAGEPGHGAGGDFVIDQPPGPAGQIAAGLKKSAGQVTAGLGTAGKKAVGAIPGIGPTEAAQDITPEDSISAFNDVASVIAKAFPEAPRVAQQMQAIATRALNASTPQEKATALQEMKAFAAKLLEFANSPTAEARPGVEALRETGVENILQDIVGI